jgi:hypothetical protein
VLTARGRNIILALMDELEFLNRNHETIAGMVEDYVNGEKDAGARAKLLKVLDHETAVQDGELSGDGAGEAERRRARQKGTGGRGRQDRRPRFSLG